MVFTRKDGDFHGLLLLVYQRVVVFFRVPQSTARQCLHPFHGNFHGTASTVWLGCSVKAREFYSGQGICIIHYQIYIHIYIYLNKYIYIYKYNIHIYRQPKFNIDAQNDGI